MNVSIVIPCYQEEGHLVENTNEIFRIMNSTKYSFEIIFVDDKSTDSTKDKILEIEKARSRVRHIFHEINLGKGSSIAAGAGIAKGKFIGHLDIDLEVSAAYIPALLLELEKGNDVVLIKRKVKFGLNPTFIMRDFAGMIHRTAVQLFLGTPRTDVQSGCKFFRREALLPLLEKTKSPGWFFDVEIMTLAYINSLRIKQIPGYYIRNKKKKSTVKLVEDGWRQFKNLVRFSVEIKKKKST